MTYGCDIDTSPALLQLLPVVLMRYDVQVDNHSFFVARLRHLYIVLSDEFLLPVFINYCTTQVCIGQSIR